MTLNSETKPSDHPWWLTNFLTIYQDLTINNLDLLQYIYDEDIVFEDPIHQVSGLNELITYFENLYLNLTYCDFDIHQVITATEQAAVFWVMEFQHPKLNKGHMITVAGSSHLKARDNKIYFHRDYFDAGAMFYEHIPLIGFAIKKIKQRAAGE